MTPSIPLRMRICHLLSRCPAARCTRRGNGAGHNRRLPTLGRIHTHRASRCHARSTPRARLGSARPHTQCQSSGLPLRRWPGSASPSPGSAYLASCPRGRRRACRDCRTSLGKRSGQARRTCRDRSSCEGRQPRHSAGQSTLRSTHTCRGWCSCRASSPQGRAAPHTPCRRSHGRRSRSPLQLQG